MEFLRVARRGKVSSGEGWKMTYASNRRTAARIGINISKRMVRMACRRHRLRRILRETFRQQWRHTLPPIDVVFQAIAPPTTEAAALSACAMLLADVQPNIAYVASRTSSSTLQSRVGSVANARKSAKAKAKISTSSSRPSRRLSHTPSRSTHR